MKRLIEFLDLPGGWHQHARLLTLCTPAGPDALIAEAARIDEALGPVAGHAGFRIELDALAVDAGQPLGAFLGAPARLDLQTSQSRLVPRPFHGHVTAASLLGANGGFARYRLRIEPWLAFLGHQQDSYLFQDKTVIEIIDEVLRAWRGQGRLIPAWRWAVDAASFSRRRMTVQYRESDLDFIKRLLVEEGLFCWFEHRGDEHEPFGSHTLVIADHSGAFGAGAQARVRFTQAGATLREDSIVRWDSQRQLGSSASHAASWDYRELGSKPRSMPSAIDNGAAPAAVGWHDAGASAWPGGAEGERRLAARREAEDARLKHFSAESTLRSAASATTFSLAEHPEHDRDDEDGRRFLITAVSHRARNNLTEQLPAALAALGTPAGDAGPPCPPGTDFYHNRFDAQRAAIPWRASAGAARGGPPAPGLLTAIVVGSGAPTHTDRELRVRVQFAWQRGSRSASREPHPSGSDDAPASDALGVWLRVATPVAGGNWGGHFTPRPGQEVLVAFPHGQLDDPIIVGALYNGEGLPDAAGNRIGGGCMQASPAAPAFFQGTPPIHGAGLAGLKTRQLAGSRDGQGGHNQLVFDDSAGEASLTLATTEHRSRLELGHLKQRDDNARLADRGHGAELATRAAAALRAGKGLLVSADARPGASGSQLDSREAIARSEAARALGSQLAATAARHGAAFRKDPPADALPIPAALGHLAQLMGRSPPRKPAGVPAWSAPLLQYSAPAGIAQLTPAGLFLVAGRHLALASSRHTRLIAQGSLSLAGGQGLGLFALGRAEAKGDPEYAAGIHLHAASGGVRLASQHGPIHAAAEQKVRLASSAAGITARAAQHVLATAQGAYLKIAGGDIQLHAPDSVTFRSSQKILDGPKRGG